MKFWSLLPVLDNWISLSSLNHCCLFHAGLLHYFVCIEFHTRDYWILTWLSFDEIVLYLLGYQRLQNCSNMWIIYEFTRFRSETCLLHFMESVNCFSHLGYNLLVSSLEWSVTCWKPNSYWAHTKISQLVELLYTLHVSLWSSDCTFGMWSQFSQTFKWLTCRALPAIAIWPAQGKRGLESMLVTDPNIIVYKQCTPKQEETPTDNSTQWLFLDMMGHYSLKQTVFLTMACFLELLLEKKAVCLAWMISRRVWLVTVILWLSQHTPFYLSQDMMILLNEDPLSHFAMDMQTPTSGRGSGNKTLFLRISFSQLGLIKKTRGGGQPVNSCFYLPLLWRLDMFFPHDFLNCSAGSFLRQAYMFISRAYLSPQNIWTSCVGVVWRFSPLLKHVCHNLHTGATAGLLEATKIAARS